MIRKLMLIVSAALVSIPGFAQEPLFVAVTPEYLRGKVLGLCSSELPALAQRAETGDAIAQAEYGLALSAGKVPSTGPDETAGTAWIAKAADKGMPAAEALLGDAYLRGRGIRHDPATAVTWLQRAADGHIGEAQYKLASLYSVGTIVPADLIKAYMWAALADKNGSQQARQLIDTLRNTMKAGDISAANAAADKWLAEHPSSWQRRWYGPQEGAKPPQVVSSPDPEYTPEAKNKHVEGMAVLTGIVDVDGRMKDVVVKQPIGSGLDCKAVQAVNKWKFKPATKDRHPVPSQITIEVNFRYPG